MKHGNIEISPADDNEGKGTQKQQSFISENDTNKSPSSSPKVTALQSVSDEETGSDKLSAEINGNVSEKSSKYCVKSKNDNEFDEDLSETRPNPPANATEVDVSCRAQEEGCVNVVFPGTVTQDGCCRFVSDILKCVLFQRQQLPMTYDQLVYSQKKQQGKDTVWRRPMLRADMDWRKCQQTLQELEEVLHQLEVLFSLSRVPRVLLLMGGTLFLPKEMYEINMEALVLASGDKSLRVSSCLRQLFRTLFVADLLSDTKPVRLMPTTVLVLAHRDCGVGWFRPKLQFKVPTRVKSKIMSLSTDLCSCEDLKRDELDWDDYIWFQAPMTIKGFTHE
uniref:Uncharacterized protein n=1 Tax=Periophthalmus magnuspinnatus TaxID=409849 RepID=A0A3B4BA28_9GOBI